MGTPSEILLCSGFFLRVSVWQRMGRALIVSLGLLLFIAPSLASSQTYCGSGYVKELWMLKGANTNFHFALDSTGFDTTGLNSDDLDWYGGASDHYIKVGAHNTNLFDKARCLTLHSVLNGAMMSRLPVRIESKGQDCKGYARFYTVTVCSEEEDC